MRKLFLVLLIIFSTAGLSFAQINLPFPDSTAEWSETQIVFGGPGDPWEYSIGKFFVDGDSSIGNQNYKKLYWTSYCDSTPADLIGFYRIDSLKVYYRDYLPIGIPPLVVIPYALDMYNNSGEVLLYDYGLQVGDTF